MGLLGNFQLDYNHKSIITLSLFWVSGQISCYVCINYCAVVSEDIHTPPKESKFPAKGVWSGVSVRTLKCMRSSLFEFPQGWRVLEKDPFCTNGMDIFWNCTMIV